MAFNNKLILSLGIEFCFHFLQLKLLFLRPSWRLEYNKSTLFFRFVVCASLCVLIYFETLFFWKKSAPQGNLAFKILKATHPKSFSPEISNSRAVVNQICAHSGYVVFGSTSNCDSKARKLFHEIDLNDMQLLKATSKVTFTWDLNISICSEQNLRAYRLWAIWKHNSLCLEGAQIICGGGADIQHFLGWGERTPPAGRADPQSQPSQPQKSPAGPTARRAPEDQLYEDKKDYTYGKTGAERSK